MPFRHAIFTYAIIAPADTFRHFDTFAANTLMPLSFSLYFSALLSFSPPPFAASISQATLDSCHASRH
jgi:hypothetical protein